MFVEELSWGCAASGLAIVMPALALSAIGQAATPEQMLEWGPECFGTPGDLKLAALAISAPEGGSDVRTCAPTPVATATIGSSTATRCGSATAASPTCTSSTRSLTRNSANRGITRAALEYAELATQIDAARLLTWGLVDGGQPHPIGAGVSARCRSGPPAK